MILCYKEIKLQGITTIDDQHKFKKLIEDLCEKVSYKLHAPYKHTTCIPRWNDVETFVSTSF